VPIQGHVGGLGKRKHREFVQASGEMSDEEFARFIRDAYALMVRYSVDGSDVTIATDYPADWGTSRHAWRMDGDVLWTVFLESDVPEDKDWFEALDSQPWTPYP
jgi:hypothetical protein